MTKIILGIDPGIADTGFGIIKKYYNQKIECINYGSIKTFAKDSLSQRLQIINEDLNRIIKKYHPDIMAIEEIFFFNNVKTAFTVGQARGIILLTAINNNIPIKEFTPLQIKQAVTTHGRADKIQVQRMVKLLLNLNKIPKPDDAADALAIAITACNNI